MRIAHLSDLHLGKRINECSMIEDQKYILNEIIRILEEQKVNTVLIAGDVYDKSTPSIEAVELYDDFITNLSRMNFKVLIISGNHDSAERLSCGSRLMTNSGVYIAQTYDGHVEPVVLSDEYGEVNFYMLPFVRPVNVRRYFPDANIENYTDAIDVAIQDMRIDTNKRNVLIAHQFVTGAMRSDSEEVSVGGLDNVDASVFSGFDYVALGHIHGPQKLTCETIRYSGTPIMYSFSEQNHKKSLPIIDIDSKGTVDINCVPINPLHKFRTVEGTYEEVTLKSNYEKTNTDDYVRVILKDEEELPNAMARLRVIYPNIMSLEYDNKRTHASMSYKKIEDIKSKSEFDVFADFYKERNGQELNEIQQDIVKDIIKKMKEADQ